MSEPFLSEIKIFSFNFAPKGWALCNGQLMPINQNQALFSLLGTTYGGDGRTTFALPNLQGKVPIHTGSGFSLGQSGGEQNHTLQVSELPSHTHVAKASANPASTSDPTGNFWADGGKNAYTPDAPTTTLASSAIASTGGSQPHDNMSPYLTLNLCIALTGIFPSQN